MPKYLDLTGLTTFKSKLDEKYAKKADVYDKTAADGLLSAKANSADVYTKAQVDSAIAGAGLPTITIALSQVVSQDPLQIQLTDEQYQIATNNKQIVLDGSALGMGDVVATYVGAKTGVILFMFPTVSFNGAYAERDFGVIFVWTSDKTAILKNTTLSVYSIDDTQPSYDGKVAMAILSDEPPRWFLGWGFPYRISYDTTAPTSANTTGSLQIVVLSSEPATRYDGYLYIITGSN